MRLRIVISIPRQIDENGIADIDLTFETAALQRIIREYTFEAGVRNLEREIGRISRKVARLKAEEKKYPTKITADLNRKVPRPAAIHSARSGEAG